MLQLSVRRVGLCAILWSCAACMGCSGGGSGDSDLVERDGASRVITLDGAKGLLTVSAATMTASRATGLRPLGDIDGDGFPDLAVALNRKGSPRPAEHTWLEAYSGSSGKLLWSLQGKHNRDPKINYRWGPFAVIADITRDGIPDIYCQEGYSKRSAFLISGRTGDILGRHAVERRAEFGLPIRCMDFDADGTLDLLFSRPAKSLAITVLSGKNLSKIKTFTVSWPENGREICWVLPTYHDDNSDGIADCLVQRLAQSAIEYAILDGNGFAVLRTFKSPRPRVGARTFHVTTNDLNGDQVGDFVMSSRAGGGPEGRKTLLRAVSGKDGSVIWDVSGDQIRGGARVWSVDVRTGKKTAEGQDIGFGNAVTTAPDFDGDGVDDLAVLTNAGSPERARSAVLIMSGKTGEVLSVFAASSKKCNLLRGSEMIRLRPKSTPKALAIATPVRLPDGTVAIGVMKGKSSTP